MGKIDDFKTNFTKRKNAKVLIDLLCEDSFNELVCKAACETHLRLGYSPREIYESLEDEFDAYWKDKFLANLMDPLESHYRGCALCREVGRKLDRRNTSEDVLNVVASYFVACDLPADRLVPYLLPEYQEFFRRQYAFLSEYTKECLGFKKIKEMEEDNELITVFPPDFELFKDDFLSTEEFAITKNFVRECDYNELVCRAYCSSRLKVGVSAKSIIRNFEGKISEDYIERMRVILNDPEAAFSMACLVTKDIVKNLHRKISEELLDPLISSILKAELPIHMLYEVLPDNLRKSFMEKIVEQLQRFYSPGALKLHCDIHTFMHLMNDYLAVRFPNTIMRFVRNSDLVKDAVLELREGDVYMWFSPYEHFKNFNYIKAITDFAMEWQDTLQRDKQKGNEK